MANYIGIGTNHYLTKCCLFPVALSMHLDNQSPYLKTLGMILLPRLKAPLIAPVRLIFGVGTLFISSGMTTSYLFDLG